MSRALSLALVLAGLIALALVVGPPRGDFANYFTAARLWVEGADLTRIYDYRWFTEQASREGFGDRLVGFAVLPPHSLLLAVPLLPLGLRGAELAWWGLQLALAAGLALVLSRRSPLWTVPAALALAGPALHSHLVQGQFHLPAVLAVALGFAAWRSDRDLAAGLAWGLAVGLKVHAWPLLVLAALARRWRCVGVGLATLALGLVVSVGLLGWDVHRVWLSEIAPAAASGWFIHPWHPAFQSFGHALRATFVPHVGLNPGALSAPPLARGLQAALALGVLGATFLRALDIATLDHRRLFAATLLGVLATGPLLALYHLTLLLPALAWALPALSRRRAVAVALLVGLACWLPAPDAWPALPLLGVPRAWALLVAWALVLPPPIQRRRWTAPLVAVSMLLGGLLVHSGPAIEDGATPLDSPAFPLILADLDRSSDGSLSFSGLSQDRQGHPGRGWMTWRLPRGGSAPEVTAALPDAHAFSARPAARSCLGGTLLAREGDIYWHKDDTELRLTRHPAHDTEPVCDPEGRGAWFLSDRDVGVRALRLWWVPLQVP